MANLARWQRLFAFFNRTLIEMLFSPENKMAPCRTDWCLYSTQYHTKPVKQTHQSTGSQLHFAFGFYCPSLWKALKTSLSSESQSTIFFVFSTTVCTWLSPHQLPTRFLGCTQNPAWLWRCTAESSEALCRRHDDSWLYLKSTAYSSNMKGDRTVPRGAAELLNSCSGTQLHSCRIQDLCGSRALLPNLWG